MLRTGRVLGVLLVGTMASSPVGADSIGRPSLISARGVGMGGAVVAAVDDPTALHFNPAGLSHMARSQFVLGGELLLQQRSYTPTLGDGSQGAAQDADAKLRVAPVAGWATRLSVDDRPSRVSFGIGLWNTYGGIDSYDPRPATEAAIESVTSYNVEAVPGLAYQVNDVLSLGAAFRFGFGRYDLHATGLPGEANIDLRGFGVGAGFGITVTPSPAYRFGLAYRTGMDITLTGDTELPLVGMTMNTERTQRNPQRASIGAAFRPAASLLVSTQLDWINWQAVDQLVSHFPNDMGTDDFVQEADLNNGYQAKVGVELAAADPVRVRAGAHYDSNVVPERTMERVLADSGKLGVTGGASYQINSSFRLDAAVEYLHYLSRTVDDNRADAAAAGWPERANLGPGEYDASHVMLEIALVASY